MADIELVIRIPEEDYLAFSELSEKEKVNELSYEERIIANGTPLPKGHGRLIDERQITKCTQVGLVIQDGAVTRCLVTDAPTILEAERQSLKQIREKREGKAVNK